MKNKVLKKGISGTQTEKNLWEAFAGECEARVRYEIFANIARDEEYEQIASIFEETSLNEKEHAEIWYEYLGQIFNTENNLRQSSKLETYEATDMYIDFSNTARREGFPEIAEKFKLVAQIEKAHSDRYTTLLENILNDRVFKRCKKVMWQCRSCGFLVFEESAPQVCPVCEYPQGFYQLRQDNF